MITKTMIEETDAKIAKEREEILKLAEEVGLPMEDVVEIENAGTYATANMMKWLDENGAYDNNEEEN